MKLTFITAISTIVFAKLVSAQVSTCAAQQVLDTCLDREKNYLKYCSSPNDYACLCKVNTALVSCYDNCPQDIGKGSIQGLKDTYCSIAQTYNTTTTSVSSSAAIVPSVAASTNNLPSNTVSIVAPSSSISNNKTSMSCTNYQMSQGVFIMVAGITTWYLV